jgi:hypothetical protein
LGIGVFVGVLVGVLVGVFVGVLVGVLVGVFVGVLVGVLVATCAAWAPGLATRARPSATAPIRRIRPGKTVATGWTKRFTISSKRVKRADAFVVVGLDKSTDCIVRHNNSAMM